jgi:hypothetical protein
MFQNDSNARENIITIDKTKNNSNNFDSSFLSQTQTTLSVKEPKRDEELIISDFQEIIKPIPIIYAKSPFEGDIENVNYNQLNQFLNRIKIGSSKKSISFIGKKRYLNTITESLKRTNKDEENKIKEIESENSLNKSAFKKIEIGKEAETCNKSAFKAHIIYTKVNSNNESKNKNKSKSKKIENKIIINEMNNNKKIEKTINFFTSINYNNDAKDGKENNSEYKNKKRKRGRKPKYDTKYKKVHDASDYDNILRKIQVYFLTFIISFVNDLIENLLPNNKDLKFKNLSYNLKKTVNHSYVENLKNKTIGEILQFEASSKNKKFSNTINQQIFQKVIKLSPFLNNFFNMSYLHLFNNYYLKCNRTFNLEGVIVNISQKTKLFNDLIQKNCEAADKIKQIAVYNYLDETNEIKQPIFVINKKDI